ncbi:fluoride efflux transporter CrcB [Listeria costaricensis]|uniref:fluoride efflux transporter CrcB n=1 Tax=Listeria costaricensis TaxID=2026604 RepID=UPI000C074EF3|nr:fluoride efflux transporter CrcB [Listeria costaricensis]
MMSFLLVGLGAAFGGMTRYGLSTFIKGKWPTNFPVATFFINLTGSFLLAFLISSGASETWQLLLGTGFMGGYTTFSTFQVENIELHLKKKTAVMSSYLLLSFGLGLGCAALGLFLGQFV